MLCVFIIWKWFHKRKQNWVPRSSSVLSGATQTKSGSCLEDWKAHDSTLERSGSPQSQPRPTHSALPCVTGAETSILTSLLWHSCTTSPSCAHPFMFGFPHFPTSSLFCSQTTHSQLSHRQRLPVLNRQWRLLFPTHLLTEPHALIEDISVTEWHGTLSPLHSLSQSDGVIYHHPRKTVLNLNKSSFPFSTPFQQIYFPKHPWILLPFLHLPPTALIQVIAISLGTVVTLSSWSPWVQCDLTSLTVARVIFPKHKHACVKLILITIKKLSS